eukprot:298745_1
MGAFAPSEVIAYYKPSLVNAYTPYGLTTAEYNVYWYFYPGVAFGFSPTSTINLIQRGGYYEWYDNTDINSDDNRLTWSFYQDGLRAGTNSLDDNANWQKIIYYKQCEPIVTPLTPSPNININQCDIPNNIVHDHHIHNNLIAKGWQIC